MRQSADELGEVHLPRDRLSVAMITFNRGKAQFSHRAVAIILHGDRVLLQRAETDDFWFLPGGRVELLEPSTDALRREMREELDVEVHVERLVWVAGNIFEYGGRSNHELGLYFLVSLPTYSDLYGKTEPFEGDEEGLTLIFKWTNLDELEGIKLYPTFLKQGLRAIPDVTEHIVHVEGA